MTDFFRDIIDIPSLCSLLASMQQATGIPVRLIDHRGEVMVESGWPNVCTHFNRQHPDTAVHCLESDRFFARYLEANPLPEQGFIRQTCRNGIIELGLPIVINGTHVATLLFGQFLPEELDLDQFRAIAAASGIDEKEYIRSVIKMPVYDQALVDQLLAIYEGIADLLVRLGRTRIEESLAQQELKHSEEKFRDLFNNSSDAIYIVSLDGTLLEVNRIACERQGYTPGELKGKHVTQIDDPQFKGRAQDHLSRFRQGESFIFETAHLHKDGTSIPVEVSGRVIEFEGKKAIMASARDLRERHDALLALKRSETKFRSIVDSSPMGVLLYYIDPQNRLIFTGSNAAADNILGVTLSGQIGKTIEVVFPNLIDTEIPSIYRKICAQGGDWSSEHVNYEDENIRGAFEVHAFQTAPKTMAVFFLDITERKLAEVALRESEEKYRMLFSAEKDAILIIDSTDLSISEVNQAAVDMYGYSLEEFSRLKATELWSEPLQSQERIQASIDGRLDLMQARHRKKDGTLFPVEITAGTFEWQQKFMLVAIIRDCSERERITRMKDEMLSAISHEMRTPLTAILGFTELLLNEKVEEEKVSTFLKLSYQEGERLRELIDDLLDLQRLRAGFTGNKFERIEIRAMLQEIADIFTDMTTEHQIVIACPSDLPRVVVDEQKLHRLLKNLMSNAVKYSPGGGKITLTARLKRGGRQVTIAVADQGLGIPREAQGALFDRFFRVYHPEIKNIGGTGLGLALVKEIVNLHEGTVSVKSAPGKGSTFTIELPVAGPLHVPTTGERD